MALKRSPVPNLSADEGAPCPPSHLRQILQPHRPKLAAERQALAAVLLLGEAADAVRARVVDTDPPATHHRETAGFGKAGVAHVVWFCRKVPFPA
jgi:hypothetical protein